MTNSRLCTIAAACLLFPAAATVHGQITTQNSLTPEQLVNTVLVGQGVSVSNVMFNGMPANTVNDQAAYFDGTNSNIGLNNGIVLATGKAELVQGPNNYPGLTVSPANPRNTPDPDLSYFVGIQHCVAVLEFDFVPVGDSLNFRFVFGSEEYPEYVCSQFNDVFGFFLSGPGINGPYTNNAVNLAVVPGTQMPVAINTINPGTPGIFGTASSCAASDPNWQNNSGYYVSNPMGSPTVELDGFTVPLIAGTTVQCGQVYHIKIAIAHAGDTSLDSAVLIEGGSFSSGGSLTMEVTTPFNFGSITEGCLPAMVTLARPDTSGDATIALSYAGTATAADLDSIPAQITIPAGSYSASFPLGAGRDGQAEGTEEVVITATWTSACGFTITTADTLAILDYSPLLLSAEDLYLNCDQDSVSLLVQVSGGLGDVQVDWGNPGQGQAVTVPGMDNGTYTATATDQCPESASITVHVFSGCELHIPNVISPNSDGLNDAWVISGRTPSGAGVQIFNRWGNEVFSSGNYANNWRAPNLPEGTYFYLVTEERSGQVYKGHLTVLRNGGK
jgi:gliding motility-associated-like protein